MILKLSLHFCLLPWCYLSISCQIFFSLLSFYLNLVLPVLWFFYSAFCSRLHNVQHSSFSGSFYKIPFLCSLLITYVRLLYRRGLPVFPSIYSSILFVPSSSYFVHLPTSNSYVPLCFVFNSSVVSTSLLTIWTLNFLFLPSRVCSIISSFFCLPFPLSKITTPHYNY